MFMPSPQKFRQGTRINRFTQGAPQTNETETDMQGKTKRIPIERLVAITEFFMSLIAQNAQEVHIKGHSMDFYAAVN